jgi:polyisoprenoid-binding protein YceI
MKKLFYALSVVAFSGLLLSCESTPESDKAETSEAQAKTEEQAQAEAQAITYSVDLENSRIGWIGSKKVGNRHEGFLKLKSGELYVKNNELVGGKFVVDMNSLTVTDLPEGSKENQKLTGHLKSADFFEVETYPEASFEITEIKAWDSSKARGELDPNFSIADPTHEVSGNLTIKGITKGITFPAKITVSDNNVEAVAKFNINRYDWNVNYGKGQTVEDKIINPEVNLSITLKANKQ